MKKIVLIPNKQKDKELCCTQRLVTLLKGYDCETRVLLDSYEDISSYDDKADLYIALGGDGTIMRAAHIACNFNAPILGINLGRVGYMAELEVDELDEIDKYFKDDYSVEERMMLSIITPEGKEHLALNDMVLSNGTVSKMITFSLYNKNELIRKYNADGIIVATPTGSTAYSMAAGGSILDPSLDCIAVTPVCPHSFSARPIVFSGDAQLRIENDTDRDIPIFITVDGGDNLEIGYREAVIAQRSNVTTKLLRLKKESFYRTLSNKMNKE